MANSPYSPLTKSFLADVRFDPRFQSFVADMQKSCPLVPEYDPINDNINEVKYRSLQKQGFMKLLNIITG